MGAKEDPEEFEEEIQPDMDSQVSGKCLNNQIHS